MANNFSKNQGELLRFALSLCDTKGYPVALTTGVAGSRTPTLFFAGNLTYTGTAATVVPFSFEYSQAEADLPVRGTGGVAPEAIYKVDAYVSADTTTGMAVGRWDYSIKYSESSDPSNNDAVVVLLEGVITINQAVTINPDTTGTSFVIPTNI
jgi:hypothetical protein|tara:strand:+ start:516 stop:974 length:459 start_codon:yes stop_codon:yes gene_type:complete